MENENLTCQVCGKLITMENSEPLAEEIDLDEIPEEFQDDVGEVEVPDPDSRKRICKDICLPEAERNTKKICIILFQ